MEIWNPYAKIQLRIHYIENFSGGNGECTVTFKDTQGKRFELYFHSICDFRYAIENAFIVRDYEIKWAAPFYLTNNERVNMWTVENSKYKEYYEYQVRYTDPDIHKIIHFVLFDEVDTGIEILAYNEPVLREISGVPVGKNE